MRLYMKEEWRNRFEEEIIPNSTSGLTEIEVAEIEAREILKVEIKFSFRHTMILPPPPLLQWWRSRFPEEWKPETDSWEFANWMLRKYHDDLEEREKVDGFDHRVYGPRGN